MTKKHNPFVNPFTQRQVERLSPVSVVDVGCGDGFYGKMCRDICGPLASIVGVDANPKWAAVCSELPCYDAVILADIVDVVPVLKGDLAIAGDVLEHLEEEQMTRVLEHLVQNFAWVIVNSPNGFQPQAHEDTWEIHRCGLNRATFANYHVAEWNIDPTCIMFNALVRR